MPFRYPCWWISSCPEKPLTEFLFLTGRIACASCYATRRSVARQLEKLTRVILNRSKENCFSTFDLSLRLIKQPTSDPFLYTAMRSCFTTKFLFVNVTSGYNNIRRKQFFRNLWRYFRYKLKTIAEAKKPRIDLRVEEKFLLELFVVIVRVISVNKRVQSSYDQYYGDFFWGIFLRFI